MKIESVTIQNFRCIGEKTTINFQKEITTFIGTNGTGKTTTMLALQRMFGLSEEQKRIKVQDFHIPHNESNRITERNLSIEVILIFPSLDITASNSSELRNTISLFWQQLSVNENGKIKCRLRLESKWHNDGSIDGYIETNLYGIRSLHDDPNDSNITPLKSYERSAVQIIYIPANRNGVTQITQLLKSKLWKAIKWQEEIKNKVLEHGIAINQMFSESEIIGEVTQQIQTEWNALHSAGTYSKPSLQPIDLNFDDFIKKMNIIFSPNEQGSQSCIQDLSDGQRSLFHLAMTMSMIRLEATLRQEKYKHIYEAEAVNTAALTIIALEEPENCLSPFYLSKIFQQLKNIASELNVQAIISSHSSAILNRMEPESIRYFKLNTSKQTEIKEIILPPETDEASRYIREAVKAYPEIYFARLVIFGEGDSEEIILPHLAEGKNIFLDRSFVAVVPLGGRHVNHFWRLVNDLNIPHITLLDLDKGRSGGGWGRIKYVIEQLVKIGYQPNQFISEDEKMLAQTFLDGMGKRTNYRDINNYIIKLEEYNIFFSSPLDIDWSMLKAFPDEYRALEGSQKGPQSEPENAKKAVLKDQGEMHLYSAEENENFRWYNYLFLGRGKPASHINALSKIEKQKLIQHVPEELDRLLNKVNVLIGSLETNGDA